MLFVLWEVQLKEVRTLPVSYTILAVYIPVGKLRLTVLNDVSI